MNRQPRLLTPHLTSAMVSIHEAADAAYQLWSSLYRQFDASSLISNAPEAFPLYPLHAIKYRQDIYHVVAGFDAYQTLIPSLSAAKKSRVSILCYPDLELPDIERLSLKWTVNFIKNGCLDRRNGHEMFRRLLDTLVDKRVLEQVCGISRMSRTEFARVTGIPVSALKAQASKFPPREKTRVTAKHYVLERLE